MTVTLTAQDGGTLVQWDQEFETAEMAAKIKGLVGSANEENLDRLGAVLAG